MENLIKTLVTEIELIGGMNTESWSYWNPVHYAVRARFMVNGYALPYTEYHLTTVFDPKDKAQEMKNKAIRFGRNCLKYPI